LAFDFSKRNHKLALLKHATVTLRSGCSKLKLKIGTAKYTAIMGLSTTLPSTSSADYDVI
jgi:hypothetical protein